MRLFHLVASDLSCLPLLSLRFSDSEEKSRCRRDHFFQILDTVYHSLNYRLGVWVLEYWALGNRGASQCRLHVLKSPEPALFSHIGCAEFLICSLSETPKMRRAGQPHESGLLLLPRSGTTGLAMDLRIRVFTALLRVPLGAERGRTEPTNVLATPRTSNCTNGSSAAYGCVHRTQGAQRGAPQHVATRGGPSTLVSFNRVETIFLEYS